MESQDSAWPLPPTSQGYHLSPRNMHHFFPSQALANALFSSWNGLSSSPLSPATTLLMSLSWKSFSDPPIAVVTKQLIGYRQLSLPLDSALTNIHSLPENQHRAFTAIPGHTQSWSHVTLFPSWGQTRWHDVCLLALALIVNVSFALFIATFSHFLCLLLVISLFKMGPE